MWIDRKDKLPDDNQTVFVKVKDTFAVAWYSKHFGFVAEYCGYDIYVDDTSGMDVTLDDIPTHWMPIPKD